jgi:hypothetical protein
MKFLNGNKNRITNLIYLIVSLIALASGADYHQIANGLLAALGWQQDAGAAASMAVLASQLWAAWAFVDSLGKAYRQRKAGATLAEINTPTGVIKEGVANGTIRTMDSSPVLLTVADSPRELPTVVVTAKAAR